MNLSFSQWEQNLLLFFFCFKNRQLYFFFLVFLFCNGYMCFLLLSPHSRPRLRELPGCEWVSGLAGPLLPPLIPPLILPSTHLVSCRLGHHADSVAGLDGLAVSGLGSRQLGLHHHQGSGPEGSHPERPQKHPAQHHPHHDWRPGCWVG